MEVLEVLLRFDMSTQPDSSRSLVCHEIATGPAFLSKRSAMINAVK